MAGDWIKMRTDLYRDPKVSALADSLMDSGGDLASYVDQNTQCSMSVTRNVIRNAAVGALVSVWGVMRHQGKRIGDDLMVPGSPLAAIDDVADLAGFGAAMVDCGWLKELQDGLCFPRFFEAHNVDPRDDQREKNRDRQQRYRDRKRNVTRNVTVASQCSARVEKERESIKGAVDATPDAFELFWSVVHRKTGKTAAKKAYTAAVRLLKTDKGRPDGFDPHEYLRERMAAFAQTPRANPTDHTPIHPATWLNQGRYDDDPETWQGNGRAGDPRGSRSVLDEYAATLEGHQ